MATFLKAFGAVLLGVVLLLDAGVAVLLVLDWNVIRDEFEATLSGALGRAIEIGELDVEPGWTSRIALTDLRVANAGWAEDETLQEAERVVIFIEVWPLLGGKVVLPGVTVTRPRLSLERKVEGPSNGEPVTPAGEVAALNRGRSSQPSADCGSKPGRLLTATRYAKST